jgi:signal recognition particle subunit SRP54
MFNSLSDKILNVLGTFKKKSVITEKDLKNTLRDLRIALLEADVSIKVVMSFIKNVEEKAIGSNIYNTITPYQMIVKILHQEIINTLSDGSDLLIQKNHTVYMLVGLQGSGKTTSAAKLAYFLKNKHKKRILLASVDTFRMAAYEQLQILASQISVDFFTHDIKSTPLQIAKEAYKFSQEKGYDTLILDTAGRISTDKELMDEIKMDFDPNYGSTFYINNKFFGEIRDITFATRVANIWLHPNSTFKETRDFLLKNE